MPQLSTAGGLTSTVAAPEPIRFSSTGAGVPQTSCRTGCEISTSAAIGASSFTHSRKPAMISASDQPGVSPARPAPPRAWRPAEVSAASPARVLAADALFLSLLRRLRLHRCRADGRGLVRGRRLWRLRLRLGPRSPRGKLESGICGCVLGERNRFDVDDFDRGCGRLGRRRGYPGGRILRQQGQRREAEDRRNRQPGRHGNDRLGQERQHPRGLRHALSRYSTGSRIVLNMGKTYGRTVMARAAP